MLPVYEICVTWQIVLSCEKGVELFGVLNLPRDINYSEPIRKTDQLDSFSPSTELSYKEVIRF